MEITPPPREVYGVDYVGPSSTPWSERAKIQKIPTEMRKGVGPNQKTIAVEVQDRIGSLLLLELAIE